VCSSNSAARRSNPTLYEAPSERLAAFVPLTTGTGSFDSRASRKREAHFAQDDRCWVRLTSTINVFSCGISQNALRVTASVAPTRTTTVAFALWQSVAAHQRRISSSGRFTKPVILSGVTAERSEAVTESKEPMPACGSTSTARHSHDASVRSTVRTPTAFVALTTGMGSFDSQASRKREARFAQDDRC
jgi:hypothetical protein